MSEQVTEELVKVGTIFDSSWGYDQTNIDFYEVVSIAKSGKSVVLQKVGQTRGPAWSEHQGHERVRPDRRRKVGDPFRRKLHFYRDSVGVSISSYQWASLWSGDARYQTAAGWGH